MTCPFKIEGKGDTICVFNCSLSGCRIRCVGEDECPIMKK